jgi:hypothetical protein
MIYVAAGLVVGALVAMASGKVDPLLSVLVALILAGILGIAPADQLAAGLSNAGVITVAAMLVIAKGIVQTGVVSRATWRYWLRRVPRNRCSAGSRFPSASRRH